MRRVLGLLPGPIDEYPHTDKAGVLRHQAGTSGKVGTAEMYPTVAKVPAHVAWTAEPVQCFSNYVPLIITDHVTVTVSYSTVLYWRAVVTSYCTVVTSVPTASHS